MYYIAPSMMCSSEMFPNTRALSVTVKMFIFVGVWNDRLWPDDWTAVTTDGKRSAQFEHTLLVSVNTMSLS
jgi:ABC-type glycerol-3-phosphate transport system permease component